jgi:hypothetical protein
MGREIVATAMDNVNQSESKCRRRYKSGIVAGAKVERLWAWWRAKI